MRVFKKLDKRRESFLPITDNFLAFCIVFEWCRIFESAMDKKKVKFYAKLCLNYFSVNVSVLAIVSHRQILKNRQFQAKLSDFQSHFPAKKKKRRRKNIRKYNKSSKLQLKQRLNRLPFVVSTFYVENFKRKITQARNKKTLQKFFSVTIKH